MSEKKSRVSRYQRLHVGVDEFKKQQVVNKESIHRLHEMAQKVETETIHSRLEKHEPAIFIVEEENVFDEVEEVVEDEILVEEVKEEVTIDELSVTEVLNNLKETLDVEEPIIEVVEAVEPEVEEMVTVETNETVDQQEVVSVEETEVVEEIKPTTKVKKSKKERWNNFCLGFFTFCNVCALICFFVAYGPFHQIRDLFVTTAMRTMTKKYLANVLYSTETIQEILATNVTIEPNEVMDSSAISIGQIEEPTMYSSVYEEQVLKRGEGEDLYKIVRIDENGYEGYAVFVYDPTKITVATTKHLGSTGGEFVTDIARRANAKIAVNGGGFNNSGQPSGYVYKDGKIIWARNRGNKWAGGTIGFSKEGVQAGIPLLGICLGMQVLFEDGYEVKHVKGLGLLKGSVTLMEDPKVKIPHIGWNALNFNHHTSLQNYLPKTPFVYFVHSYRATQLDDANLIAYANYGSLRIPALVQKGNVIGAQFHPEKSAKDGLAILKWFEEEF